MCPIVYDAVHDVYCGHDPVVEYRLYNRTVIPMVNESIDHVKSQFVAQRYVARFGKTL